MSGQFYQPGAGMRYRTAAYPANPYVPTSPGGSFGNAVGRGGLLPGGYSNDKLKRPNAARRLRAIGVVLLVCLTLVLLFFALPILQAYRTQRAPDHPSEEFYETRSGKQTFGSIFNKPDVFLSVVVPAYNEEKRMKQGVSEMLEYLSQAERDNPDYSWEVILVDDGSKDRTYQTAMDEFVLSASSPAEGRVRVLKSWANGGKGAAVRKGVMRARGRYVLMADADGATQFKDVEALLEVMTGYRGPPPVPVTAGAIPPNRPGGRGVEGGGTRQAWADRAKEKAPFARKYRRQAPAQGGGRTLLETPEAAVGASSSSPSGIAVDGRAFALGSRSAAGGGEHTVQRSALRKVAQWGFHTALRLLLGAGGDVQDTQCGFKLFTRRAAAELFTSLHIERWAFDVELVYLAARLAIPLAEVPVTWHEVAGSKLDVKSASIQMLRDIVVIRACYSLGIWSALPSTTRGLPVPGLDRALAQELTGDRTVVEKDKEVVLPSIAELLANMAQQDASYARQQAYARKWAKAKQAFNEQGQGQGQAGEEQPQPVSEGAAAQQPDEAASAPAAGSPPLEDPQAQGQPEVGKDVGAPPLVASEVEQQQAQEQAAPMSGGSDPAPASAPSSDGDIVVEETGQGEGEAQGGAQGAAPVAQLEAQGSDKAA